MMMKPRKMILLIVAAIGLSNAAWAQSVLKDHDTYQAIEIDSERFELKERNRQAVFSGTVRVIQGGLLLNSDTLTVFYQSSAEDRDPTINRLAAQGKVRLTSETENVESDWTVYDVERRLLTFGGNVILKQGGNTLKGERLELNLITGITKLDGNASSDDGRVRGTFSVPDNDSDPSNNN